MRVIKRDGRIVKYDENKIVVATMKAMTSIGEVDEELANKLASKVTHSLKGAKEVSVEDIQDKLEDALIASGRTRLAKEYILYRAKRTEARNFREAIGIEEDDLKFGVNTLSLLDKRYLKRRDDGRKESPSQMFKRVASHVASVERQYGSDTNKWTKIFYNLMADRYFLPNTPCLANSGNKDLNYLFACYAFNVGDSMLEILETAKQAGIVQTTGGGVGLYLSDLRPAGDIVKRTEGIASGPVTFMEIFNTTSNVIKQGGIRRGGNLGLMLVSHPDIYEFVDCKSDENKFKNFNISVALTDEFMSAVRDGKNFALVNPKNGAITSVVDARSLFRTICEASWRTGEPGIVFWDTMEKDNPTPNQGHLIKNLCGEQDLVPNEACCLGSINLEKFVDMDEGKIVWSSLRKVVQHTVRFLDDVIDATDYPLPQIEAVVKGNRKIGLGVMGFANMLVRLGIPYDSDDAIAVAEEVMSFISNEAKKYSAKLAEMRGDFPNITTSVVKGPRRNASMTTIAPTGSISMIAETSSGIEPIFAVAYEKGNILDGQAFFEINPVFIEIGKKEGWYSPSLINKVVRNNGSVSGIDDVPEKWQKVFRTAYEVHPDWHVRMQAAFQRNIDNSISKTVNLPVSATVEDIENIILLSYDLGLKGITVFRDESRSDQVLRTLCPECEDGTCPIDGSK